MKLRKILISAALFAASAGLQAQGPSQPPSTVVSLPAYVGQTLVPSNVREFLVALGDRIQKPGKERLILVGRHTDSKGTVPATLTWEAPGNFRYDRTGAQSTSLVLNTATGLLNAASVSAADLDVLESLLTDGPESFLYGWLGGNAHRFLGGRFRMDDGKAATYSGPRFDIYEDFVPIKFLTGAPVHPKLFFFDSETKLLGRTAYKLQRGGATVNVSTEFGKWIAAGGNATPGQIVRKENAAVVFTFDVTAATISPKTADGLFSRP